MDTSCRIKWNVQKWKSFRERKAHAKVYTRFSYYICVYCPSIDRGKLHPQIVSAFCTVVLYYNMCSMQWLKRVDNFTRTSANLRIRRSRYKYTEIKSGSIDTLVQIILIISRATYITIFQRPYDSS